MKKHFSILLVAGLAFAISAQAAQRRTDMVSPLLTQPQDKLLQVLQSNADRKAKADACRELGVVGDKSAIPVLVPMLADPEMHHMARHALETLPGSQVDAALREQLSKLQGRQLIGVIGTLGVRKDAKAVKPLSELLTHSDRMVVEAAARAIGSIGTADSLKILFPMIAKNSGATQVAFAEGYLRATEAAAKRSTRSGGAAYDKLVALSGLPPHVQVAAIRGSILTSSKSASVLENAITGNNDAHFIAAISASLEAPSKTAKTLTTLLPNLPRNRQFVVAQTLGAQKYDSAIPALNSLATGSDGELGAAAVRAIAQTGSDKAVPALVKLVNASQREVAQAARDGLAGLTIPSAEKAAIKLAGDSNPDLQIVGVDLIGRRRMVSSMPVLMTAASSQNANVRNAAYRRIGELSGPSQAPDLLAMVSRGTSARDLEGPAEALSRIVARPEAKAQVTDQVIAAYAKASPAQKIALLNVLQAAGGEKPLAAVRGSLNDSNADLKDAAIRTLADWPDTAAASDLLQIAKTSSDTSMKVLAFRGYVRIVRESDLPAPARLKMLQEGASVDSGVEAQKLILSALGDLTTVPALQMAASRLTDPALADEAAAAVVRIAERLKGEQKNQARPYLEQAQKAAKSPAIQDKARKLLEQ